MGSSMVKKLKIVNKKFFINLRMREIQTNFYSKLLTMGIGKNYKVLEKLKTLPVRKDDYSINRANKFERNMVHFFKKYIIIAQAKLRINLAQGVNAKSSICKDLVVKNMKKDKQFFIKWSNMTKRLKQIQMCRKTQEFMETVQT